MDYKQPTRLQWRSKNNKHATDKSYFPHGLSSSIQSTSQFHASPPIFDATSRTAFPVCVPPALCSGADSAGPLSNTSFRISAASDMARSLADRNHRLSGYFDHAPAVCTDSVDRQAMDATSLHGLVADRGAWGSLCSTLRRGCTFPYSSG
jgi:hypothetical protein